MTKQKASVKYSIFGNYGSLKASPENVSRLFSGFSEKGFMPNMLTTFVVQQPQGNIQQELRPQLINTEKNCIISILPDRIDIEFSKPNYETDKDGIDFMKSIIKIFELQYCRIALNTSTIIEDLTEEDIKKYNNIFNTFSQDEVTNEDKLIEYTSRCVIRKRLKCIDEPINIGKIVNSLSVQGDESNAIRALRVDTDINTLANLTEMRFSDKALAGFFYDTQAIDSEIVKEILCLRS